MRVNIVQGPFNPVPPLRGGAVEKVWVALGEELARIGCEVTHISRLYQDLPAEEVVKGVRHLRVAGNDVRPGTVWPKLIDLAYCLRVRRVLPPADITVTNAFFMPVLLRGSRHGAVYVHVARFPKGQMGLYRHVARLQPVSSLVGRAIARQTPAVAHLVKPLANPIPEHWVSDEAALLEPRTPTVLYVGRIHPEKGIDLLIDAFALLPEPLRRSWKLSVVGPWKVDAGGGGDEYLGELKSRATRCGVVVDWVGPVFDERALMGHYDRSEIFVYPSRAAEGEALPLAPIEAMARGNAPIVSAMECFGDYLRDGVNGLTFAVNVPNVAQQLANSLERLIADQPLRQSLRREALRTASGYSVRKVAQLYLADFRALIENRRRA